MDDTERDERDVWLCPPVVPPNAGRGGAAVFVPGVASPGAVRVWDVSKLVSNVAPR